MTNIPSWGRVVAQPHEYLIHLRAGRVIRHGHGIALLQAPEMTASPSFPRRRCLARGRPSVTLPRRLASGHGACRLPASPSRSRVPHGRPRLRNAAATSRCDMLRARPAASWPDSRLSVRYTSKGACRGARSWRRLRPSSPGAGRGRAMAPIAGWGKCADTGRSRRASRPRRSLPGSRLPYREGPPPARAVPKTRSRAKRRARTPTAAWPWSARDAPSGRRRGATGRATPSIGPRCTRRRSLRRRSRRRRSRCSTSARGPTSRGRNSRSRSDASEELGHRGGEKKRSRPDLSAARLEELMLTGHDAAHGRGAFRLFDRINPSTGVRRPAARLTAGMEQVMTAAESS